MPILIVATTLVFVGLCIAEDLRIRRIPNLLTAVAAFSGLVFNAYLFGVSGLLHSLGGLAVNVAVLFGPFALGGVGGGDVKMMGAVGALLGTRLALSALLCGLMLGGVIMALHLARQRRLREKLVAIRNMLTATLLAGSPAPLMVSAGAPGAISLPYSIPLASGTIVVVLSAYALGFSP